jgi:recombination protein RecA
MDAQNIPVRQYSCAELKQALTERWPESLCQPLDSTDLIFSTGLPELDRLFPSGGIPYGQMIEITGEGSSGKTSLLILMLAAITRDKGTVAYVDYTRSFFPTAAVAGGIDLERLLVVTAQEPIEGLRTAELLLNHHLIRCAAFDLVGITTPLPFTLIHRLRTKTTRARALVIFLTDCHTTLLPTSSVSLRLEIHRRNVNTLSVTVAKSRLCHEGTTTEVIINGG